MSWARGVTPAPPRSFDDEEREAISHENETREAEAFEPGGGEVLPVVRFREEPQGTGTGSGGGGASGRRWVRQGPHGEPAAVLQPGAVPLESLSYTRQVALLSSELDRARLEAANHRVTAAEAAANAAMLSRRIREQTLSSVVQGQRIDAVVGILAQALTAAAAGVGGGAGGGGPPPFLLLCCAAPAPPSARKSRARPAEAPAAAATAAGMGCRTSRRPPLCSSDP